MMNTVYLLLGSNQGNPESNLTEARKLIRAEIGMIIRKSSLYQTAAWGFEAQPDFLNQVLIVDSPLAATEILNRILMIEKNMGRVRTTKNAARIIDIDILFYNDEVIELADLQVPHPAIQFRRFVLIPLNELSPAYEHPSLHKKIADLLDECADPLAVKKI